MDSGSIGVFAMERRYEEYLSDESRRRGEASEICFPDSREALAAALDCRLPVTVQGSRTGLDGRAVPRGGRIVNLGRMDRLLSCDAAADG
ncbi:MAG: FAD-binding oxidoreductase, partial [Clostridia bacterium]|nr:FAD-binding oxidoreductase [Clostridia bacterium]